MEREIELEGCVNFRDVGGYPADGGIVRWRRLFRSDALHELTPADVARLKEIGLTTVIDLRSDYERGHDGDGPHPLADLGVRFLHAPLITELSGEVISDTSISLAERYARILELGGPALAATVTAIAESAESGGAAVFHCAAGKDRTGMVSAVVLGALGVSDEDLVADYAMTGRNLAAINDRLRRNPAYETTYAYVPKDALTADAETMAGLIQALRARHGDMAGLLRATGVSAGTLDRLRGSLVTADSALEGGPGTL